MWFELLYTFLGGLGLFFLGMKSLSEALQLVAGNLIRRIIRTLTTNRLLAVGVGTAVTALVQSSSVTTVMVVGLVNAGLMELTQAIGVIMGANIGTTLTGWILAIKIGKYGPLLIGIGIFPFLFARDDRIKGLGKFFVALGLIFLGLESMSDAFKPLRKTQSFLDAMQFFSADSYLSLWACILVGAVLTCIIQSSSAMLGVTIALASTGAITYQTSVALVLGENIGTTITAILASVGTNSGAKRAARAHAIFNVLGVLWLSPLFWIYLGVVDSAIGGVPDSLAADGSKPFIAAHIAGAHSLFNVLNVIVFLPFLNVLARVVTWLVPEPKQKEVPHLKFLPSGDVAPELGLEAAERELDNLAEIVARALNAARRFVRHKSYQAEELQKINKYEVISDSIQAEITRFLSGVLTAPLTRKQANRAYAIIRAADELESIADYCAALGRHRARLNELGERFTPAARKQLREYFDHVMEFFEDVRGRIGTEGPWDVLALMNQSDHLTDLANHIRELHLHRLTSGKCSPGAGMLFSDMMVSLRKMKAHLLNIAEALGSDTPS